MIQAVQERRVEFNSKNPFVVLVAITLVIGMIGGCGDPEDKVEDTETVNSNANCENVSTTLVLDEAHNYSFSSSVDVQVYEVQGYPNVPVISWDNVKKDILGHPVTPDDVGYVLLSVWGMSAFDDDYATFEEWLNTDALDMNNFKAAVQVRDDLMEAGVTEASLADFYSLGVEQCDAETYFQTGGQFDSENHIFVLMVGRGNVIGQDAIMAAFVKPVDSSDAQTDFNMTDDAVSLTYLAVLNENKYIVPRDKADILLDWTELLGQKNAIGQEFTPNHAGRVMLTFYAGKTIEELQSQFLDLEVIADRKYTAEPYDPTPILLTELKNENQERFPGFGDEDGVWLLSLWCTSSCNNPAPKYMTIVESCG